MPFASALAEGADLLTADLLTAEARRISLDGRHAVGWEMGQIESERISPAQFPQAIKNLREPQAD